MGKTDKELSVELMIATLNHFSSVKYPNGSAGQLMSIDNIINNTKAFYKTISELEAENK